jgi:cytochrome c oxidase subunit 2
MSFESRMLPLEDILATDTKQLRLLEVDHMLILPIKMPIRLLVTAADVLHS